MSTNRFVGSWTARVAVVVFALLTIALASSASQSPRYVTYAAVFSGILTWLSLVHAVVPLFRAWMRFAEFLHNVAVTVLFGACYLLLVPFFHLLLRRRDPLHLRRSNDSSSWIIRTGVVDASSLERMG
jgi:hypothetical protein